MDAIKKPGIRERATLGQTRVRLSDLPPSMAERAVRARTLASQTPSEVEIDDELLPWIYDNESNLWLSFDGNYSTSSPGEKRLKEMESRNRHEEAELRAQAEFEKTILWSKIRQAVLERDHCRCQVCGMVAYTSLHIHHILKRNKGGTDHLDNLITLCSACHKIADTRGYDPDWTQPPKE